MKVEEKYMRRCITLARSGMGETRPNPMVGAVIVNEGKIIGEGFHQRIGEPHAEVNAIASVREESLLPYSTMYVSLEPCSHYGKTPPCAELIIRKRIPRVVVGCLDPYPEVSGRGIRLLRDAGVEVVTGVLEKEARTLNKAFMAMQEKRRPYVVLKWAQSADGYIDRFRSDPSLPPVQFSTSETRRYVHKLRAEMAAIMVGTRTALLDNPSLTVRHWVGPSPVRIVVDRALKIPASHHLFDGSVQTLVFTSDPFIGADKRVAYVATDFSRPLPQQVLDELYRRRLESLLVEGGSSLLSQFLAEGLWDEIQVETASFSLGDGVKAPALPEGLPFMEVSPNQRVYYQRNLL